MGRLAASYDYFHRFDNANKLREETFALSRLKLGRDHPDTLVSMTALAGGYARAGRHADGIKLLEQALEIQKAKAGPNDPATLSMINGLGYAHTTYGDSLRGQGQFAEARREYLGALKIKPNDSASRHRDNALAAATRATGKPIDCRGLDYAGSPDLQPKNWEAHHQLELLLRKQGQHEKAEAELKQVLTLNPGFSEDLRRSVLPVRRFLGHSEGVGEVVFSPDGCTALSCGGDGMRLWDLKSATQLRTFVGHSKTVSSVVFSHNGRRALSSGGDGTLQHTGTIGTGQELRKFEGHSGIVYGRESSLPTKDGCSRAAEDNTVRYWDVKTGRQLRLFEVKNSPIRCVAIFP